MRRILALLAKDLLELRRQPGVFLPATITGAIAVALPFLLALGIPAVTGERLSDASDYRRTAEEFARLAPRFAQLGPEARVQAALFQQFVMLLVLIPISASMAVAAYSIVGEKQARALEPLLATPVRTGELLIAKILAALLPALALSACASVLYLTGIAVLAAPGVFAALFSIRTLLTLGVLGPLAALVGLQLAVIASSRASDPRSAQQIGVVLILPVTALLVAQVSGALVLTIPIALAIAAGLLLSNVVLFAAGVRVFDREAILTRWK